MSDLLDRLMLLTILTSQTEPPTDDDLADAPLLESWILVRVPGEIGLSLVGSVIGHPRLGDRPAIVTSELVAMALDHSWARTRSRWYRLGTPAWGGISDD